MGLGLLGDFNQIHHPLDTLIAGHAGVPVGGQVGVTYADQVREGEVVLHDYPITSTNDYPHITYGSNEQLIIHHLHPILSHAIQYNNILSSLS